MTDRQDHFYVCQSHANDRGFCSPIVDEAEVAARKKKEEMNREIEIIKKEYDDKRKIKGKGSNGKEEDKGKDNETDKRKEDGNGKRSAEDGNEDEKVS